MIAFVGKTKPGFLCEDMKKVVRDKKENKMKLMSLLFVFEFLFVFVFR